MALNPAMINKSSLIFNFVEPNRRVSVTSRSEYLALSSHSGSGIEFVGYGKAGVNVTVEP